MKHHSYCVHYDDENGNRRWFNMYATSHDKCVAAAVKERNADPATVITKQREPLYLKGNQGRPCQGG